MRSPTIQKRSYYDETGERLVVFHSNAPQKLIDSLSFNGEWNRVKEILLDWDYKVIEHPITN